MMEIPTPAEFYSQRDDRTNSEVKTPQYQKASLLVAAEREVLETYAGRVLARTLTNLTSRFCRNVDVAFHSVAPDSEIPANGHTLAEQCLHQMWAADPHGRFGWVRSPTEREYDCVLAIGNPDIDLPAASTVLVDGGGWEARVVRSGPVDRPTERNTNPIGPITAACLGIAEVFKTVNGASEQQLSETVIYDAFLHEVVSRDEAVEHPPIPNPLELGTIQMIGVGSVGSAAVHFLGRLPVEGRVQLVDHDAVELVNLNRSPLFQVDHALGDTAKVEVAKEYLDSLGVESSAHNLAYDEFETKATEQPDVVLPLANERNVRSAIQHNRPPLMLHATTSGSEVTLRRHIPVTDPCLLCHFPPEEPQIDPGCATAPVSSEDSENSNSGTDAALSFASFLAGCFVAAELAKLPLDTYPPTDNVARVLTLTNLGDMGVLQYPKEREDNCVFCSNSSSSVHAGRINGTRFDHLTDTNRP